MSVEDRVRTFRSHLIDKDLDKLIADARRVVDRLARLRRCPSCGIPFLRNRRQEFCSDTCGQKVRNGRKHNRKRSN